MDDLFRRFLGLPPRRPPNIDDFSEKNDNLRPPSSEDKENFEFYFTNPFFGHTNPDTEWKSAMNDDFSSVFRQMEQNMEIMSRAFSNFHEFRSRNFGEGSHITEHTPRLHDKPRDELLKNPEAPLSPSNPQVPTISPYYYDRGHEDSPNSNRLDLHEDEIVFVDPFQMMGDMLKSFSDITIGSDVFQSPFDERGPNTESDDTQIGTRESLIKKDTDLDNKNSSLTLPKEGPGYSYSNESNPHNSMIPFNPHMQGNFKSSSIVRIVKPDGTIEETRKYRDSSGMEEVTVTHIDPQDNNPNRPQIPNNYDPTNMPPQQCVIS